MKKNSSKRIISGLSVYLIIVAAIYHFSISPQSIKIEKLKKKLIFETSINQMEEKIKEVSLIKARLKETVNFFQESLLPKDESSLTHIGIIAKKSGIEILSAIPFSGKVKSYDKISFRLSLLGNYNQTKIPT